MTPNTFILHIYSMKHFGTDGTRGVFGKDLSLEFVERVARAILQEAVKKSGGRVVIGNDTRFSGDAIVNTMRRVFDGHAEVIYLGVVPTTAVMVVTPAVKADIGIMVTASHNPYTDNGIKLVGPNGEKMPDHALTAIDEAIDTVTVGFGINDYVKKHWCDYLVKKFEPIFKGKKLPRVAFDFANGSGAGVALNVMERLGFDVAVCNNEPTGTNINANCGALHPEGMAKSMAGKVDVMFAVDGDADRCITIDGKGEIVDGSALLAAHVLHKGQTHLVSTVMFNAGTEEYLKERGITVSRTPVGDRYVVAKMKEVGAKIGGEPNGHANFAEVSYCDDGLVTCLVTVALMVETGKSLREIIAPIPAWFNITHNTPNDVPAGAYWRDDCRLLIRKSGTEKLTRVYIEGRDEATVKRVLDEILNGK